MASISGAMIKDIEYANNLLAIKNLLAEDIMVAAIWMVSHIPESESEQYLIRIPEPTQSKLRDYVGFFRSGGPDGSCCVVWF